LLTTKFYGNLSILTSRGYYEEPVLRETVEKPLKDGRIGSYRASPVGFTFRAFGGKS
jgi:hypothetical protein